MMKNKITQKMRQLNKLQSIIMLIGACLMVIGAGLYVFGEHFIAPMIFTPGTVMFAAMQIMQKYEGTDTTLRRLRKIMLTGCAFFILAAVLMIENSYHFIFPYFMKMGIDGYNAYVNCIHNNWVVALLVAAILQLYSSMRISSELRKQESNNVGN